VIITQVVAAASSALLTGSGARKLLRNKLRGNWPDWYREVGQRVSEETVLVGFKRSLVLRTTGKSSGTSLISSLAAESTQACVLGFCLFQYRATGHLRDVLSRMQPPLPKV
jgi:hypothetical protein